MNAARCLVALGMVLAACGDDRGAAAEPDGSGPTVDAAAGLDAPFAPSCTDDQDCDPGEVCAAGGCHACEGPPLTAQSQVMPNTRYCGGVAHEKIDLAVGDTWTAGEVTGADSADYDGVLTCADDCTLVKMYVHDNPGWAGLYIFGDDVHVIGGRFTANAKLGIGTDLQQRLTLEGVEVDHNGATADCGDEGGGIKLVSSQTTIVRCYVHDNRCPAIWFDGDARQNEIAWNQVIDNSDEGIYYEISSEGSIHDNEIQGNGFFGGAGCEWFWGGGITISASYQVDVFANRLTNNCNGITGTQQDRPDAVAPAGTLDRLHVSGNTVSGTGQSGVVSDNGADLGARDITFTGNTWQGGHTCAGDFPTVCQ